jgi:hypothetical protein
MPSHQIRVQQNNCNHKFPTVSYLKYDPFHPLFEDNRVCEKCEIKYDKVYKRKLMIISNLDSILGLKRDF